MPINLDGTLDDWTVSDRLDLSGGGVNGYALYGRYEAGAFIFALSAPTAIGASTTFWLNTDLNRATGYQVWGFAAGAEFNINFDANGVPGLYTGAQGETPVAGAVVDYAYDATRQVVEIRVSAASLGNPTSLSVYTDVNDVVFLPTNYDTFAYTVSAPAAPSDPVTVGSVTLDGALAEWTAADRIDATLGLSGYEIYGKVTGDNYVIALKSEIAIGANTTAWLNTDQNTGTGFKIFGFAGGAEYNVNFDASGNARLYTGDAGQTLVANGDIVERFSADQKIVEFAIPKELLGFTGTAGAIGTLYDVNDTVFLPTTFAATQFAIAPAAASVVGSITLDGSLTDWTAGSRIDGAAPVAGYEVYGRTSGDSYVFAIKAPAGTFIGGDTTIWLNTDQNVNTGFDIFAGGPAEGGAEFNINLDAAGVPRLYTGAAGGTAVGTTPLLFGRSADGSVLEVAVSKTAIGNPSALNALLDVNNAAFLPGNYSGPAYTVQDPNSLPVRTETAHKVAIVYSETTAARYFGDPALPNQLNINETAYSQLFMSAQNQAAMAGVPFDLLTESDLLNLSKLVNYDAIIFPSFQFVKDADLNAIQNNLTLLAQNYSTSLITAGNFMTNAQDGSLLAGDPYERMKVLFDLQSAGGSFPVNVQITSAGTGFGGVGGYTPGEVISTSTNVGYLNFADATPGATPLTVVGNQTVNGQTSAAVVTSSINGDRNVHFSTQSVMADNNQLWQAIQYAVNGDAGPSLGLQMGRQSSIVASRNDMDTSRFSEEVNPAGTTPGIYDKMLPILEQWKADFNFVGSYYVNVGDNPAAGEQTILSVSLPYYQRLLAMGNEIGSHSLTHLEALTPVSNNTNVLTTGTGPGTFDYEFRTSRDFIQTALSSVVPGYQIAGAAVPGAPEYLATAEQIIQYYSYLSGGYSSVNAGYAGAFGFLTPQYEGTQQVYIAPNMSFDFTLIGFQQKTAEQALAIWQSEFAALTAKADVPVVVWPWHDYGPTNWGNDGYTTTMFTEFLRTAATAGAEFVTLEDLADRIRAFNTSSISFDVNGDVIEASVTSMDAGKFGLDIDNLGGRVISSVDGWYAYDQDSIFLDRDAGDFTITLGTTQADVTRIIDVGDRNDLISLTGDGTNLSFTIVGEGLVVLDLKNPVGRVVNVTGATAKSLVGEILTLDLGGIGSHNVAVLLNTDNSPPAITSNGGGESAALSFAENGTGIVTTVTARENDVGQTSSFSIDTSAGAGADGALFTINPTTGALVFKAAPDFEMPRDAGANNVYDVTVKVTDNFSPALSDTQLLSITVTNVLGTTYNGTGAANTFTGTPEADTINGLNGNDTLSGAGGNDRITGGAGADRMSGGAGADIFVFASSGEIGNSANSAARDIILDFTTTAQDPSMHDILNFSAIDANTTVAGNQAFVLLAQGAAITAPGQLAWSYNAATNQTLISGNTGGSIAPEFILTLAGSLQLSPSDFIL